MTLPQANACRAAAAVHRCLLWLPLLALAGCQPAVLDPVGPVGMAERSILYDSMAIMLVIVVPTILAALGFMWWFRRGNPRAKRRPDFVFSGQLELVTWSIPVMTIMLLGGVSWIGAHDLDPARPLASSNKAIPVQVVSLDWKWLFIYPDQHIASVNSLVLPVGTPVQLSLTSASVMNSFFVPRLGSMIYTMNGMVQTLYLQADVTGEFPGLSAHFSGDGFSDMHFTVRSVSAADFGRWVAAAGSRTLDDAAYRDLSRQSIDVAPMMFGTVSPGLFQRIATQQLPPGPGPDPQPHPQYHPAEPTEPHHAG